MIKKVGPLSLYCKQCGREANLRILKTDSLFVATTLLSIAKAILSSPRETIQYSLRSLHYRIATNFHRANFPRIGFV